MPASFVFARIQSINHWPKHVNISSSSSWTEIRSRAMSDADSAGSHGRAGKALRSAGGRVARVRKQFEADSALPSPSARTTASAPQVPAATGAPKSAGRKRKASQQRLAATAAASPDPDASGSTPAAHVAPRSCGRLSRRGSWATVRMTGTPYRPYSLRWSS